MNQEGQDKSGTPHGAAACIYGLCSNRRQGFVDADIILILTDLVGARFNAPHECREVAPCKLSDLKLN